MVQLFKRANDKSSSEADPKDPTKQKWNDTAVFVKVGNEMVPLSELRKLAKENEFEAVQKVENEIEIDGEVHDISNLITKYQAKKKNMTDKEDPALQAAIKGMPKINKGKKNKEDEEDEKEMKDNEVAGAVEDNEDENVIKAKKNEDEGKEELEKGEEEGAKKTVAKKGNATPEEKGDEDESSKENAEDEDEDIKEKIMKQSKENSKDLRHFIRLNSARELGDAGGAVLTIDTMHNRIDRGKQKYGSDK